MDQYFLHRDNVTKYPMVVINSDDGQGNLVAYDENNPLSGWTPLTDSPHAGLWVRVIFSNAYVNFKHDGATWVVHSVELNGGGIVLFSSTEANTGLKDELDQVIYCKTFSVNGNQTTSVVGIGRIYETDIPKANVNRIVDIKCVGTDNNTATWIYYSEVVGFNIAKHVNYENLICYSLVNDADINYLFTIYYTKN